MVTPRSTATWPSSGWSSPVIMRNSVVLPAPLGPTRPTFSPLLSAPDASIKRRWWPFCLLMLSRRIMKGTRSETTAAPLCHIARPRESVLLPNSVSVCRNRMTAFRRIERRYLSRHNDIVAAERRNIANTEIAHGTADLGIEDGDRAACSGLARCADSVERGAADRHRVGAERQTLEDVTAAPESGIHDDLQPAADRRGDVRQHLDRLDRGVKYVAGMIRDENAVGAARGRLPCVVGMQDTFDEQRARPEIAQPAQKIPIQRIVAGEKIGPLTGGVVPPA